MFNSVLTDVTDKNEQSEQSEQQSQPVKKASFSEQKAEIVARRREEYESARKIYGNDPNAHNFLILLECRLKNAEGISNDFQLQQQLLLPKLTMG